MKARMKNTVLLLLLLFHIQVVGAAPKKPKLIVAVMVDQFRYDYLTRFRSEYNSGIARMLEHGAVFTDAHHISAPTVTAIGHSSFMSGATPSLSGIAANEWWDRQLKKSVTSVSDDDTKMVGGPAGRIGSSPHRMLVSTLGDEMKMQGGDSKVIGVSIKDRSAILPAGHMADAAYWFDGDSKGWVSSTYYMKELPPWVQVFNRTRPSLEHMGKTWMPFDAPNGKPFCTMANGSEIPFCGAIEATPWGNDMIETFAERVVIEEKMGKHGNTDLLTVSYSSNDYVGHELGPDSPQVRDISIRTDRLLGKFFDFLNHQVGEENVLIVMSADHGVSPVPEVNRARRMPGGRLSMTTLINTAQEALGAKYGPGKWVEAGGTASLYLNLDLIRSKKLDRNEVDETAAEALRALPHAFRVYTRDALMSGRVPDDFVTTAFRNGFNPERSADVLFLSDPFYIFGESGTSHGTPYNYDTHVPVIFMGAGIKPGPYYERVAVNDVAPTLAAIVGVPFPSGSVGHVLSQMFE